MSTSPAGRPTRRLRFAFLPVVALLAVLATVMGFTTPAEAQSRPSSRDFTVAASPGTISVTAGQSATFRVNVRRGSRFRSALRYRVDNPFDSVSVGVSGSSRSGANIVVNVGSTAPPQSGQIRIIVSGGGRTRSVGVNVQIGAAAPPATNPPATNPPPTAPPAPAGDFNVVVDPPTAFTVNAGGSATLGVFVSSLNGYTGTPRFEVVGLPAGVAGNFVNPSSRTGTNLIINVSSSAARGTYPITIRAIDGDKVKTVSTNMTIQVLGDFTLTAAFEPNRVGPGGTAVLKVTLGAVSGAQIPDVELNLTGIPPGAAVSPASVKTASTATFNVTMPNTLPENNYAIGVRGVSGSIIKSTSATVLVSPKPLVTLTPASQSIAQGGQASFEILYTAVPGVGTPALTTPSIPAGLNVVLATNADGRRFLQVSSTASTPKATYTILVAATSGAAVTNVSVQVVVT